MQAKRRVIVYSEYWSSRGGGEKYLLCLVEALLATGRYDVLVMGPRDTPSPEVAEEYFGVNIHGVQIHVFDHLPALRRAATEQSSGADIFVYMTNFRFLPSRAGCTVSILQVPYGRITPATILSMVVDGRSREAAKDLLRAQLFRRLRMEQKVAVYSEFVRSSIERVHNIPATVLAPPIDDFRMDGVGREKSILSVGRFFRGLYNDKRYDVLIDAFKMLCDRLHGNQWHYHLAGSCGKDTASRKYLEELRGRAHGYPIHFHPDTPLNELRLLYNRASLFWHAAGYGVDEGKHPERMEHFGMTTVEAMSAGCIPIVINAGGQKEIVTHGESGYLWSTLPELVDRTSELITNSGKLEELRRNARNRFRQFDRARFSRGVITLIQTLETHGKI